ncbi:MAG: ABC transporter substrate-binding protein, partial [Lachnospiraceae bacterium]
VQYAVFNPAAGYLVNSETYSMNGASLDQIMDDARIQYICGQIDESGLQAAIKNWEAQGGAKVKEEVNALYKADETK